MQAQRSYPDDLDSIPSRDCDMPPLESANGELMHNRPPSAAAMNLASNNNNNNNNNDATHVLPAVGYRRDNAVAAGQQLIDGLQKICKEIKNDIKKTGFMAPHQLDSYKSEMDRVMEESKTAARHMVLECLTVPPSSHPDTKTNNTNYELLKSLQAIIPPIEGAGYLFDRSKWIIVADAACCTNLELSTLFRERLPAHIANSSHVLLVAGDPRTQRIFGPTTYIFCARKA